MNAKSIMEVFVEEAHMSFYYDHDRKIRFHAEPGEKIIKYDEASQLMKQLNNVNRENEWMADAIETYLDLYDYYSDEEGARVVLTSLGDPVIKFDIIVDFIKSVELHSRSPLAKSIVRSNKFWINSSALVGNLCLEFAFISNGDKRKGYDESDEVYLSLLEEIVNNIGDVFGLFDMDEMRIDADELYNSVVKSLLRHNGNNTARKLSRSYMELLRNICVLLSKTTCCVDNCPPPEYSVITNEGSLRINFKVEAVETEEINAWLPPLLSAVSGIYIVHTGGSVKVIDTPYGEQELGYLVYDISIDIPVLG